ncbi:TrbI/VirB10 family protein [Sphingomonas sp. CGMCC 1.13654]|uniref:TrbI/VirB10 family protein n=1 Tax=Sphingomonas chungangi TaxID=2683589 RepID=A0A838L302_9SPHN|nr:TrbI/VirB10 family protein [Sphingomonas chungangi]MBA2932606.1 TrbI/VirB10 family protein [Sphingomonas chungangi]MVW56229.1 conjugal transfer protein TrbI [Sphingomonas chungangi]
MSGDEPSSPDIRPMVASPPGNRGVWAFAGVAVVSAGLLFYTLEARRTSALASIAVPTNVPAGTMISSPPDIQIPPAEDAAEDIQSSAQGSMASAMLGVPAAVPRPIRTASTPMAMPPEPSPYVPPMPPEARQTASPPFDGGSQAVVFNGATAGPTPNVGGQTGLKQGERVNATTFQNPSTTIPMGTVIQAVLETALDSNHAGFARALVSKDVYGFDGTKILVPKGSRLIGEYKADISAGQNRALVQWQRLMRPDGVIIDLDSPSADPLGRAGIKGKVNGHFFERFSGAILQSALDIGVQLASQHVERDTVVLALPGTSSITPTVSPDKVQRTLTVKEGTSVSVFVSRDLDFSSVTQ